MAGKTLDRETELSPEFKAAEHSRLSGEIRSLARKSAWKGVDQTYDRIARLEVEMSIEDHLYGARAATELGDVGEAFDRLLDAVQLQPGLEAAQEREIVDWLWAIEQSYGRVHLSAPDSAELGSAEISLDPVHRKAVERAVSLCDQQGGFQGLLPEGRYIFAGQPVQVTAGEEVQLLIQVEEPPKTRLFTRIR